jgi:hypothetical protein
MKTKTSCDALTVPELKELCKANGIKGFSTMTKEALVNTCCKPFKSEMGVPTAELGNLAVKERDGKAETIATLKEVITQKMLIASEWLKTYEKSYKRQFSFGPSSDKKTVLKVDPVYRRKRDQWGMLGEEIVDFHKGIINFDNPFRVTSVPGDEDRKDSNLNIIHVDGKKVIFCSIYKYESTAFPCFSEHGHPFLMEYEKERKENIPYFKKKENPIEYNLKKLEKKDFVFLRDPGKAKAIPDDINVLDMISLSLANANNALDELKTTIISEKERMKREEASAKQQQSAVKESLKDWGKL